MYTLNRQCENDDNLKMLMYINRSVIDNIIANFICKFADYFCWRAVT